MTVEGGPLQASALPAAPAATAEGGKNLQEAVYKSAVKPTTKKPKKDTTATEPAEPKTLDERASEKMEECLKKGADGRKFGVSLESLEYSGDLASKMLEFSKKMETVYKKLQELRSSGSTDEAQYEKMFSIIDSKLEWFTKAEVPLFRILQWLQGGYLMNHSLLATQEKYLALPLLSSGPIAKPSKRGRTTRLLPLLGAEFYNKTEFVVWSVGSALSEGHVWDIKFPIACAPHEAMVDPNVNDSEF
ncbi:Uncharacterized protein SCF082_LOCUS51754 [Durusdinium trenchii]|uniref:Uncharacterized protein n=1 Tax=Durusdinium trenchii TaxID=1381693 RepID=A0ABP0SGT2_9DINO